MTEQPPVPPHQPPAPTPPTGPTPSAGPTPPDAPKTNIWQRTTSTQGGRWAVGIGAAALASLMLLGIGLAGLLVLRGHDRIGFMGASGDRHEGFFRGQDGPGMGGGMGKDNGRGRGAPDQGGKRNQGGMPGMPGGRDNGPGGLGGLFNGTALHGSVTVSVNGSVQALLFQRGEVTAVSATSITLKSSDGFTGTYGLTSATKTGKAAAVKGGQTVVLARASDKVAIRATAGKTA